MNIEDFYFLSSIKHTPCRVAWPNEALQPTRKLSLGVGHNLLQDARLNHSSLGTIIKRFVVQYKGETFTRLIKEKTVRVRKNIYSC
jgi:hypothetical protein